MKQLNVRFSEAQALMVSDISEMLNMSSSDVARAALYIGLNEIMPLARENPDRGIELTALNAVKAK